MGNEDVSGGAPRGPKGADIGLALSGGGFRATLFHLGVLRLLYEFGCLKALTRVASVSGGSIMAAHLLLNWERYTAERTPSRDPFDEVAQEVIAFVQKDVRGKVVRRWILGCLTILPQFLLPRTKRWSFTNLLQYFYSGLYHDKAIKDLQGPDIALLSTSLSTGKACFFDSSRFHWPVKAEAGYMTDSIRAPNTRIAFAVAASSAFPPLFPPIEISHQTLYCGQEAFPNSFYLADGGVYDNLGIEQIVVKDQDNLPFELLLVSDAEGSFDAEFNKKYTFLVSRNVRASDLLMMRVSSLQFGGLAASFSNSIHISIKEDPKEPPERSSLFPEMQRAVANARTDLDEFSPLEITALIAHGFSKARSAFIKRGWLDDGFPMFSWDPLGNMGELQEAKKNIGILDGAKERKWRLWSRGDWVSWASAGFVACAILVVLTLPAAIASVRAQQAIFAANEQAAQAVLAQKAADEAALTAKRLQVFSEAELQSSLALLQARKASWQLARLGSDCPGQDISQTVGPLPDDSLCTNESRSAVCWDGLQFNNRGRPGAWCTYKHVKAADCVGGTSPGRLYTCVPQGHDALVPGVTSYRVCVGDRNGSWCPQGATFLSCDAPKMEDWARSVCHGKSVLATLASGDGGKCGYVVSQLTCAPQ